MLQVELVKKTRLKPNRFKVVKPDLFQIVKHDHPHAGAIVSNFWRESPMSAYDAAKRSLLHDVSQEIALLVLQLQGRTLRECSNAAKRRAYHFWRECGFYKRSACDDSTRGWAVRELPFPETPDED